LTACCTADCAARICCYECGAAERVFDVCWEELQSHTFRVLRRVCLLGVSEEYGLDCNTKDCKEATQQGVAPTTLRLLLLSCQDSSQHALLLLLLCLLSITIISAFCKGRACR
jgi:hypothetical protein